MSSKNSRNAIEYLKQALVELLMEKDFEEISITELCDRAEVNRGSFYYHFVDKYDMVEKFKQEILEEIHEYFESETDKPYDEMLKGHLQYLSDHMPMIHAAYKAGAVDFPEIISDVIKDTFTIDYHQFDVEEAFNLPFEYAMKTYISAVTIIITDWISNNGDKSVDEMYDLINNLERNMLEEANADAAERAADEAAQETEEETATEKAE